MGPVAHRSTRPADPTRMFPAHRALLVERTSTTATAPSPATSRAPAATNIAADDRRCHLPPARAPLRIAATLPTAANPVTLRRASTDSPNWSRRRRDTATISPRDTFAPHRPSRARGLEPTHTRISTRLARTSTHLPPPAASARRPPYASSTRAHATDSPRSREARSRRVTSNSRLPGRSTPSSGMPGYDGTAARAARAARRKQIISSSRGRSTLTIINYKFVEHWTR